jgi:hypothetical protein
VAEATVLAADEDFLAGDLAGEDVGITRVLIRANEKYNLPRGRIFK